MQILRSELDVIVAHELKQTRRMRAQCGICGHTWRPRNSSHAVNRCPGCMVRGHVTFAVYDDKPQAIDVPNVPGIEAVAAVPSPKKAAPDLERKKPVTRKLQESKKVRAKKG